VVDNGINAKTPDVICAKAGDDRGLIKKLNSVNTLIISFIYLDMQYALCDAQVWLSKSHLTTLLNGVWRSNVHLLGIAFMPHSQRKPVTLTPYSMLRYLICRRETEMRHFVDHPLLSRTIPSLGVP